MNVNIFLVLSQVFVPAIIDPSEASVINTFSLEIALLNVRTTVETAPVEPLAGVIEESSTAEVGEVVLSR